jgi:GNAT superfamily N-acetyltransferase
MTARSTSKPFLETATPDDAAELALLHAAAASQLTKQYGHGPWSSSASERVLLFHMRVSTLLIARRRGTIIATLRLQTKKPWAIDKSYFTPCKHPLYLTDMAVLPRAQRRGIGRRCLEAAALFAREWPADSIRLDAYDAEAGAGRFYQKCGYSEVGRMVFRRTPLIYFELML